MLSNDEQESFSLVDISSFLTRNLTCTNNLTVMCARVSIGHLIVSVLVVLQACCVPPRVLVCCCMLSLCNCYLDN